MVMEYVCTLAWKYSVNFFILHNGASLEYSFTFWMSITSSIRKKTKHQSKLCQAFAVE